MNRHARNTPTLSAIAAAMLTAYGSVEAAEVDEVTQLTKPESSVSVGASYLSHDNQRFGQYTGMRDEGAYGILDFNFVNRDDNTGTWFKLDGRNLGLDSRELRFEHTRQGDWGYFIEFGQTPRYSPYVVETRLSGIGTGNQIVNGESIPRDVQLKTERKTTTLGFNKQLPGKFDFQVRFRHEEKEGSRLFGRSGTDFLAEPIDSTTQQLEATLGYTGERLQLSGGYYGGWYNNRNPALYATGGTGSAFSPIGLPPDNESHQLHLAGGYSFTPTTRGTFKLAYARATQNDQFIVAALPGNGSLDGRVDTTQLHLGLSSRPLPKLSLLANFRYEDRNDKTPVRLYSDLATSTSTFNGYYEPRSIKTIVGKLEAGYQLPLGFRVVGGVDRDIKRRNVPSWFSGALVAVTTREKTDETTHRLQLRRSLSETVNGALSYARSKRGGSDYVTTVLNNGATGSNLVAPPHLADRERDLWRLALDWAPTEPLSLQFAVENATDLYSSRDFGPRNGKAQNYSVDAAYTFSDKWQATAWLSRNNTQIEQATRCVSSTASCVTTTQDWSADLRNLGEAIGMGVRGKPVGKLEVGADLQFSYDRGEYQVKAVAPSGVTLPPDTHYRLTSLKLFGNYALKKNTGIGVKYVYERWSTDDWAWTNWTYSDGTRVQQDLVQRVHIVGIHGYYKWW
ncbi:MAG: MtrB/PioB family decaheme-associated outer membrane protein [Gammaproteobacteria bacterium]|nr:MtrB/PioB family decaheme-associated outer membrane protein [Gammaproteobacteria bacterium]